MCLEKFLSDLLGIEIGNERIFKLREKLYIKILNEQRKKDLVIGDLK
jgi:hypothetical protein